MKLNSSPKPSHGGITAGSYIEANGSEGWQGRCGMPRSNHMCQGLPEAAYSLSRSTALSAMWWVRLSSRGMGLVQPSQPPVNCASG